MNDELLADLLALVETWRYSGKAVNATHADILRDECAEELAEVLGRARP